MADPELDMDKIDADLKAALAEEEQLEDSKQADEESSEPEYTEAEQKALAAGWIADEDTLKEMGKEFIPAEEFLRNQSWVNEINKLKKQSRKQEQAIEAWKEQNRIVAERAYEKALADLKAQKATAAADEDLATVVQLDEKIEELKESKPVEEVAEAPLYTAQEWEAYHEDFVDAHDWYSNDRVKRAFADQVGVQFVREHEGTSPKEAYDYVLQEIAKEFPKERSPAEVPRSKSKAQAVATSKRRVANTAKPAKHALDDIPDDHRQIAMTLIKTGQISEEDYLKQYFPEDYS